MADPETFTINLELSALDDATQLTVVGMRGREELSRPFWFDVMVRLTQGPPLTFEEFEEVMAGTAALTMGPEQDYPVRGVIRRIEMVECRDTDHVEYLFHLVPRLVDTKLTRGSWIYQELPVDDMIRRALTEILPEGERLEEDSDFELALDGGYTPQEYVVQYEESVFDFVSRQAEHYGIFYYFDHLGEKERVVFADSNGAFPQLEGFDEIAINPRYAADLDESIRHVSAVQQMVEKNVYLREYNYRTPSVTLHTEPAPVDENGLGDVHITGEHYWTPDEGTGLAGIRGQEMFGHKLRMHAQGSVRGLRAGHRFTLVGSTAEFLGMAREYVVVAVDHGLAEPEAPGGQRMYQNRLELLPYEAAFRPARITPKPRIYGMMHATVDAEAEDDGVSCPVDEWGRYKVVMPFDVLGETGGQASCWIRQASPATGPSWGFASQVHTGQEVVIFHVDGDPDRPVIAGAVPNFENPATVTKQNPNNQTFSSRGGSGFRIQDA